MDKKIKTLTVRCSLNEYELIIERAKGSNSLSEFMLDSIIPDRSRKRNEKEMHIAEKRKNIESINAANSSSWIIVNCEKNGE